MARQSAAWVAISVARCVEDTAWDSCRERMRVPRLSGSHIRSVKSRRLFRCFDQIAQRNRGKSGAEGVDEAHRWVQSVCRASPDLSEARYNRYETISASA